MAFQFPTHILRATVRNIAEPLSKLINCCSLSTEVVPSKLNVTFRLFSKMEIMNPFQTKDKSLFFLDFLKFMKRLLQTDFVHTLHLVIFYLTLSMVFIKNVQHIFMAILDRYDRISSSIDRSEFSIAVFIDLFKAFDALNNQILLDKFEYYGIRALPLKWFESYSHNRQQCVHIKGVTSDLSYVSCSVRQGSIFGPLLFILYIYDIVMC